MLTGRALFGIGFIIINLLAYGIMLQTGELIGDVKGNVVKDYYSLFLSAFLVCSSYFFVLFILFSSLIKIKSPKFKFKFEKLSANRIGVLLLILQVFFIAFSLLNGVNIAGSGNTSTGSIFSIFWVFFPIDLFFVIYYGFYRHSYFFKPNLAIAIVSSVLRGRADIFLLILFFEVSKRIRNKTLKIKKLFFVGLITLCFYPILMVFKFSFRLYLGEGADQSLDYFIFELFDESLKEGYFHAVYSGVEHIISRLQTVSIVSEIGRFSNQLQDIYFQGGFYPFWLEGLHGIILDQSLGEPRNVPLGTAFTAVGDFNWTFNVGDWNTNPGLAGWLMLNPLWFGGYFLYILFLCTMSVIFTKMIGESDMKVDMLWYAWAFFLMPAWFGVFFLFVYTLLLFFVIKLILSSIPPIKIMSKSL
ncbi:oligosaccharide repeat unit polymerase [Litorilituus lipolyticus]|uniref:Oligosaccharide repeat unit polymerase n=1 Tax=Litorilituus lipolyticus TaxID=2491017 RepID=A0A502L505_9GAMM|nr:oligosaccharide repeat unit polymerase [Litorilituus lipolyticus]TPH18952.1 hypothetical protein EPA86_01255 [Litorilituus lipolyticus]